MKAKKRMKVEYAVFMDRGLTACFSAAAAILVVWERMRFWPVVLFLLAAVNAAACLCSAYLYRIFIRIAAVTDEMVDGILDNRPPWEVKAVDDGIFSKICCKLGKLYDAKCKAVQKTKKELSATQELISDISHQVKTPVSNIKMYAQMLEGRVKDGECRSYVKVLKDQSDKLDFLAQSLVRMSRLETGVISLKICNCELLSVIADALGAVLPKAEAKQIRIQTACDPGVAVLADRKWTSEAVFNLLDNAVKYTAAGGEIWITATRLEAYVSLEIADNGMGIRREELPLIFKRFYRSRQARAEEGLGLGLALAREIITLEKGYLTADSDPGVGSSFRMMLPKAKREAM